MRSIDEFIFKGIRIDELVAGCQQQFQEASKRIWSKRAVYTWYFRQGNHLMYNRIWSYMIVYGRVYIYGPG